MLRAAIKLANRVTRDCNLRRLPVRPLEQGTLRGQATGGGTRGKQATHASAASVPDEGCVAQRTATVPRDISSRTTKYILPVSLEAPAAMRLTQLGCFSRRITAQGSREVWRLVHVQSANRRDAPGRESTPDLGLSLPAACIAPAVSLSNVSRVADAFRIFIATS